MDASPQAISSTPCHLSGLTRLCFSPDGETIFTGGSDCLVRIHKASDPDTEPGFHDNHTEAVTSLSSSSSHLVSASIDNIARLFTYPENQFEGFVTRSAGVPIRWVQIDKQGERVAVCSDDLIVKIIHVSDTNRVSLLSDNSRPVRSAAWDPSGKYLVTTCCDGKIKIYDTSGSTPACVKIMEGVIGTSDSDSNASCYVAWHPSGNFFAVPLRTNDIGIINKDGWTKQTTFTQDGHKQVVSELAWSPNGKYLASAAGKQILVWSTDSRHVVTRYTNVEGAISGLAFSPLANMIAFTSLDGSFHRWTDPIPADLPSPVLSEVAQAKKVEKMLDDDLFDDDEDMEDKGENLDEDFGDDWIVDDEGGYNLEDDDERNRFKGRTEVVSVTKAQEAFVPGSTPWRNKKRYLAFNMIGVIDATDQETHYVVNVEFHDKSTRRGYHFQDQNRYSMASLGEQGIVYAAPSEGDQPSIVYYRPYDSWASQSDWQMSLGPGEEATCVAAGGSRKEMGSVIVATSKGMIRFFTSSGIQRYVWRLADDVVSMVAGKDTVFIVHREGGTSLDGCQNLRYSLLDLEEFDLVQEGRIPLLKKATLTWVGFTSENAPAMYDSTGILSVLERYRTPGQARWVPLLDTTALRREGRSCNYWPVGATATHFACIILKGSEQYPWFPRPLIQEIDVQMPLLNTDNQQGKLEESVARGSVSLSILRDSINNTDRDQTIKEREVELDKEMLQLVQGACKADNLQRALDITRLMHNTSTIEAAAKVAAFYHLPGLQERIQGVKTDKERKKRRIDRDRRSLPATSGYEGSGANVGVGASASTITSSKQFSDFVPRSRPKRTFDGGGGAGTVAMRSETPMSTVPASTFIPETPGTEDSAPIFTHPSTIDGGNMDEDDGLRGSPEGKRKRLGQDDDLIGGGEEEEDLGHEQFAAPTKNRLENSTIAGGVTKNPFAKKPPASNPFAKPTNSKPLDSVKSTSFFERVDNIEASGQRPAVKGKPTKPKEISKRIAKQTTLFGMSDKSSTAIPQQMKRPKPVPKDSMTSTETDESIGEETGGIDDFESSGVLDETQIQETMSSPEWDI